MLFARPQKYAEIKRVIKKDGFDLVYINIRYPEMQGRKSFDRAFDRFYKNIASSFLAFAEKTLAADAQKHMTEDSFEPAAAVMKARIMLDSKKYCSVLCEASVFDGQSHAQRHITGNVWSKKQACLVPRGAMLAKNYCDILAEKYSHDLSIGQDELKRLFRRSAVCFSSLGLEFHISLGGEIKTVCLPFDTALLEGIAKIKP